MDEQAQESRIRVVLLDEQALFRASLARLLAGAQGLAVAGECGSSVEALELICASRIDVVLCNFNHVSEGGEEFISAARRLGYRGKFLILAAAADARTTALAVKLGASGIFLKSEPPDRLVQAITLVSNGAVWLDQRMIRLLAERSFDRLAQPDDQESQNLLTEREQKVLLGILGGLTNKKIGDNLGISEGSVKTSVQKLFLKAGVRTRSRLVRAALEGSLATAAELIRRTKGAAFAVAPSNSAPATAPSHLQASTLRQPKRLIF